MEEEEQEVEEDDRICRVCFESGVLQEADLHHHNENHDNNHGNHNNSVNEDAKQKESVLISPCACTGSQAYIHQICLEKWQRTIIILNQQRLRRQNDRKHMICPTCTTEFRNIEEPNRSRMLQLACGDYITSSLSQHALLVATREFSERIVPNLTPTLNLLLNVKSAHWKYAIYIIFKFDTDEHGEGDVRALNLTRLMDGSREKPIPDEVLRAQSTYPQFIIHHHNGGPVQWSSCRHALCILPRTIFEAHGGHLPDDIIQFIHGEVVIIIGLFAPILYYIAAEYSPLELHVDRIVIYSFSGYAQWNYPQLLGEFLRNSWGVIKSAEALSYVERCLNDDEGTWNDALTNAQFVPIS